MADDINIKKRALQNMSNDKDVTAKIMDYLTRVGAASRSGIYEAQDFDIEDPMAPGRAFMEQLGRPSEEAPTGIDIAEKTGLENPYALGTIATIADLTDPTPLGKIAKGAKFLGALGGMSKGIKGMAKGQRALSKVGDVSFPASSSAQAMKIEQALKQTGKVPKTSMLQIGEKAPIEPLEHLIGQPVGIPKAKISKEELLKVLEDFPMLRKQPRFSGKL